MDVIASGHIISVHIDHPEDDNRVTEASFVGFLMTDEHVAPHIRNLAVNRYKYMNGDPSRTDINLTLYKNNAKEIGILIRHFLIR